MKKIFFIIGLCSQFCLANNNEILSTKESNNYKVDPLQCCTRRASSGVYGQPGYNQVSVTRCATSTVSYQEAYANACTLAAASAERALTIAENTSGNVIIGR